MIRATDAAIPGNLAELDRKSSDSLPTLQNTAPADEIRFPHATSKVRREKCGLTGGPRKIGGRLFVSPLSSPPLTP
jgi:hypothetical protein